MYERESSGRRTLSIQSESVSVRGTVLIGAQESNDFGVRHNSIVYIYVFDICTRRTLLHLHITVYRY